ncbi:hypothetical protein [Streptomyces sp. NBC_00334]|uniref:hypothetical protein n=1 Tax=Streptomyces sp. NBC_00334 TaxID=2975713 RepID=UPI002E281192|nr:hypothetical protein [Streptomyces sp. NBC_00334]
MPQLHKLDVTDVDLDRRPVPVVTVADFDHPLDKHTVDILRRRLDVRAGITTALEGSDPGYLWNPTQPGRDHADVPPPKPGPTRAAVRAPCTPHTATSSSKSSASPCAHTPSSPAHEGTVHRLPSVADQQADRKPNRSNGQFVWITVGSLSGPQPLIEDCG